MGSLNTGANGTHGFHEDRFKATEFSKHSTATETKAGDGGKGKHSPSSKPALYGKGGGYSYATGDSPKGTKGRAPMEKPYRAGETPS